MKRLYREVAKRIHPDLTSDRDERMRREALMAEANKAYEAGDESQLNRILNAYETSLETVQGEGPGAELIRVIRRISQVRGRIAEIEAEAEASAHQPTHWRCVRRGWWREGCAIWRATPTGWSTNCSPGRRPTWRFRPPGRWQPFHRLSSWEGRGFPPTTLRTAVRESPFGCRTSHRFVRRICRRRWRGRQTPRV